MSKEKTTKSLKFILEIIWLLTALMAIGTGIRESYINDFKSSLPFFAVALVSLFFYWSRRNQRLKSDE